MRDKIIEVPVNRIFLSLDNPRHVPLNTEAEAIAYLCKNEMIHPLAKDIVELGTNPLELFALIPTGDSRAKPNYRVAEGNRRICAVKLLNDPDLAPTNLRREFEKLADSWTAIRMVLGIVFNDLESAKPWLLRIHDGLQGGIGRKAWNAEQKSRFSDEAKNKPAQRLLDYAQRKQMITPVERTRKISTAQRFLTNPVFRSTLGVEYQSDTDTLSKTRPEADFDALVGQFMRDLAAGEKVHSRMNRAEIEKYAHAIADSSGAGTTRCDAEPLNSPQMTPDSNEPTTPGATQPAAQPKPPVRRLPAAPQQASQVQYEKEIFDALKKLGNEKLRRLYYSIYTLELEHHTVITAVGVWSFFETLTACAGRTDTTSFDSFLSKTKLKSYGLHDIRPLQEALQRILGCGNTTKHHRVAATFNGNQLNNDMITLKPVILKCIEEAQNIPS